VKLSMSKAWDRDCEVMLSRLRSSAVVTDEVGDRPMSNDETSSRKSKSEAVVVVDAGVPGMGAGSGGIMADMAAASAASWVAFRVCRRWAEVPALRRKVSSPSPYVPYESTGEDDDDVSATMANGACESYTRCRVERASSMQVRKPRPGRADLHAQSLTHTRTFRTRVVQRAAGGNRMDVQELSVLHVGWRHVPAGTQQLVGWWAVRFCFLS
jgi:hypothetical protein